jgi:hypothetical protein
MKARHGQAALVIGSKRPAMSISFDKAGDVDFFIVIFADLFPGDAGFDELPEEMVCLHCFLEDGDKQIGEGLDMARRLGRAEWDDGAAEWFYPDDAEWWGES